jgi:predicted nucleic acid-binding protein
VISELGAQQPAPSSFSGRALKAALSNQAVRVLDPAGPLIQEFHVGEKAVLTLALERRDELMPLIDEQKAYQWAVKQGLPVMSVPLWLATRALAGREPILQALAKIKALVEARRVSMLLAHEALMVLAAAAKSRGGS